MNPAEFKAAREKLGLTVRQLGVVLDTAPRSIRKWEGDPSLSTSRAPNPIAVAAMGWFLEGFRPSNWPANKSVD